MRQLIKIIRKEDLIKEKINNLNLEIDYLLLSLFQAMQINDEDEKLKCKSRLGEIHNEMSLLNNE